MASSGVPVLSPLIYSYLRFAVPGAPPQLVASSGGAESYDGPKVQVPVTILGTPEAIVYVRPNAPEFQLNVLLYDVDARGRAKLIAHSPYTVRNATPGQVHQVQLQMNVVSHRLDTSHRLRVVISTSDSAYVLPVLRNFDLKIYHNSHYPSQIRLPVLAC
ncbi:MAG: hypothetical protein H5U02_14070 [Clostridia bacterium]|nr:hypothetical protein [Clostridia bacterium]